jgi:protein SCO1/2
MPEEKKYLSRKVANIAVFDGKGTQFNLYSLLENKPLILSPVYTKCPSVCGIVSNGIKNAIMGVQALGKDFSVLSFSFDSTDREKNLSAYEDRWGMDGKNWKAVSASPENIRLLMASIDFHYEYNAETKEFSHPSLLIVITPGGRISRYIYGINPSARELELAVMEAAAEKTRPGILKGIYLKCFTYDALSRTYKLDWSFILSVFSGLLIIGCTTAIFLRSFIISKSQDGKK